MKSKIYSLKKNNNKINKKSKEKRKKNSKKKIKTTKYKQNVTQSGIQNNFFKLIVSVS